MSMESCEYLTGRAGRPPGAFPLWAWLSFGLGRGLVALGLLSGLMGVAEISAAQTNSANGPADIRPLGSAIDLRPAFVKWGLAAREQGKRPTCSVFTLTGALEFAVAQQQRKGERLSVEYLNWAANQVRGHTNDGGFFSDLWSGFAAHGICTEAQMPYQPEFASSTYPNPAALARAKAVRASGLQMHWIKKWNVRTGLTDETFASIKRVLGEGWPVCAGCRWPKQEKWQHDVLQMCAPEAVRDGHSVLLVGYRDDAEQPGGGVFIFRNSGNDARDGYMPYAYAREYVNDALWISSPARTE